MSDLSDLHAAARASMVDGQLRPSRVNDPRILREMRVLPRELFVPEASRAVAYADRVVPLGEGRILLEPLVLVRLVQATQPLAGERALVVASGTGFGAALLARLDVDVSVIETDARLHGLALEAWRHPSVGVSVRDRSGEGLDGVASGEPFDIVLVDGAIGVMGDALARLVRPRTGRLVAVWNEPGSPGRAIIAERSADRLGTRHLFDATAATLPGFEKPRGFRF